MKARTRNPTVGFVSLDRADCFEELRAILLPYAPTLHVFADRPGNLHLDTHHVMRNGKALFFGAVRLRASYVSFHLMPLYVFPELAAAIPSALRSRMHGKSCFNFTRPDPALFRQLARLTAKGFSRYQKAGYVVGERPGCLDCAHR
jgi:hypothetical protein